jgi:NAD dependent epimerase/dehydratase
MNLKKRKVLVTGADGFIGSHLVEALLSERCKVRAFVFYNSFNSWGWLDTFPRAMLNKIEVIAGDVRDFQSISSAVKNADCIFHLAALIGIPFSYHAPESYVETNIKGTLNVLQAAQKYRVQKVIITSTSEVYGTARYVPINEEHPLQGQSPYSATKIAADKIAESFRRSFDMPIVIARPFNTYGPRQSCRAIIPTIITQLLSVKKEIKLGALHPTRDLVYVKDLGQAFLEIARSDATIGKEINIATEAEISVKELAQKLIGMISPDAKIVTDPKRMRPEKSEVERLLGSNKTIKRLTGWRPQYSLDKGLRETVEWFKRKENLKIYKSDIYNV